MLFNSIEFILFLFGVAVVYFIIPRRMRYIWLLIASYGFYAIFSIPYTLLLLVNSLAVYFIGLQASLHKHNTSGGGILPRITITILLLELILFKYTSFIFEQLNAVFGWEIAPLTLPTSIILPVGISFYTFQAIGYVRDVYTGKIEPERNAFKFLLYISFFPKIIQGPIEKHEGFLSQIDNLEELSRFDYNRIINGIIYAIWGLFLKMVIADRIAIIVDTVFDQYYIYGTVELCVAAISYAIQIYCDFAGYSAVAVGVARIFGFRLIDNFNSPYFSTSTREFWKRWHISLSEWFRDYVYFPLGGSRCSKWKKRLNIMITMLVSGIWHGAGWNFIVWGLIHGIYQAAADIWSPIRNKINKIINARTDTISYAIGRSILTFLLIDFAWIFFRANNIGIALDYIHRIFSNYNPWVLWDGSLLNLGLDQIEINVVLISCLALLVVDAIQVKYDIKIDAMIENQCLWFRWGIVLVLITSIWVFGMYGPGFNSSSFIYQSF